MLSERAQQAISHLLRLLVEGRVNAGDDDIHLLHHGVGEIELAVGQDVDFNAGHDRNAVDLLVGSVDARDVFHGPLVVESVGERQILRVVGDGDVLVPTLFRRLGHLLNGAFAVGFNRVHMHFAVNVFYGDKLRQLVLGGEIDFAAVLAHLRRNAVELQRPVDFVFGDSGDARIVFQTKEPILIQRQSHLQRALPQRDIVVPSIR